MTQLLLLSLFISITNDMILFDSKEDSEFNKWVIMDDVVMGGRSAGDFHFNQNGNLVFKGAVSLENNGGFSSIRHRFGTKYVSNYKKLSIRLKGDGKSYQFRVKTSKYDRHSYCYKIQTTGDWQTVEIPFSDMYPSFRGMQLDIPNYPGTLMEEITFLIGNKKEETFQLIVDNIHLLQ